MFCERKCVRRSHTWSVKRFSVLISLTVGEISLFCNPLTLIQNRNNVIWQISCYLGKTPADFDTSTMFNLDFNDSPVSSESRESRYAAKAQVLGRKTLCNASHLCNECLRPLVTTLEEGFCQEGRSAFVSAKCRFEFVKMITFDDTKRIDKWKCIYHGSKQMSAMEERKSG